MNRAREGLIWAPPGSQVTFARDEAGGRLSRAAVARVRPDLSVVAGDLLEIGFVSRRRRDRVHQSTVSIHADVRVPSEVPLDRWGEPLPGVADKRPYPATTCRPATTAWERASHQLGDSGQMCEHRR